MHDDDFAEVRELWNQDLAATNYFESPDSNLPPLTIPRREPVTISLLIRDIAVHAGIPSETLMGQSRQREVSRWRHLGFYAAYHLLGKSQEQIARRFNRDESTVHHGIQRFAAMLASDPVWGRRYRRVRALCAA